MSLASDRPHSRVKKTWLRILKNGTGGLIIAAAVVSAASAKAEVPDARATVSQRVEHAREWMQQRPALDPATQQPDEFAWIRWGNLLHPMWNNWPNWHNWNNWPNWPNY